MGRKCIEGRKLRKLGRKIYEKGIGTEKHGKESRNGNINKEIMEKEREGIYGRE